MGYRNRYFSFLYLESFLGQVKNRFNTGAKIFCVKFNPDEDKQTSFLCGLQNKKIMQYDTRTGEIEQVIFKFLSPEVVTT